MHEPVALLNTLFLVSELLYGGLTMELINVNQGL